MSVERNLYLGVDVGTNGALAILDSDGAIVDVSPMMESPSDIADHIREFAPRVILACVESVHAFPGQSAATMFKFGWNAGMLHMALVALKVPTEFATPRTWQTPLGCRMTGRKDPNDRYAEKKRHTKARIQELFPNHRITLQTCDAIGIAEFCRRKARGLL